MQNSNTGRGPHISPESLEHIRRVDIDPSIRERLLAQSRKPYGTKTAPIRQKIVRVGPNGR